MRTLALVTALLALCGVISANIIPLVTPTGTYVKRDDPPSLTTISNNVIITLPPQLASDMHDMLFSENGICPIVAGKKCADLDMDCIRGEGEVIMYYATTGGRLVGLINVPGHLVFENEGLRQIQNEVYRYGLDLEENLHVSQAFISFMADNAVAFAYEQNVRGISVGPTMTIPEGDLSEPLNIFASKTSSPTSTFTACLPDVPVGSEMPFCEEETCKGVPGIEVCTEGKWKYCNCASEIEVTEDTYDPDWLDLQYEFLQLILEEASENVTFSEIRLLPLGDSITRGSESTNLNGYRKELHELLGYDKVDFIGTLRNGDFNDTDHEGRSGQRIKEIEQYGSKPLLARPNVVLILAGTNDIDKPEDGDPVEEAPAPVVKTGDLLDASDIAARDYKHPNDNGYSKLANAWYDAIVNVSLGPSDGSCSHDELKRRAINWEDKVQATPVLAKTWNYAGIKTYGGDLSMGKWIIFADINGDGRDEYLAVYKDGSVDAAIFDNDANTVSVIKGFAGGINDTSGSKVRFADINGDGYADYILQFDGGSAKFSSNTKNVGSDKDAHNFVGDSTIAEWAGAIEGDKIQYADINNDGFADYLQVFDHGGVEVFLNNKKNTFDPYGSVSGGTDKALGKKVLITDIDGDGFADFVIMDLPADPNTRSCQAKDDCSGFCAVGDEVACNRSGDSGTCECSKPEECEKTYDCIGKCSDGQVPYCLPNSHQCTCYTALDYYFPRSSPQSCSSESDCTDPCPEDLGFICNKAVQGCMCTHPSGGTASSTKCLSGNDSDCSDACSDGDIYRCQLSGPDMGVCYCNTLGVNSKVKRAQSDNPIIYMRNNQKLSTTTGDGNWDDPIEISPGESELTGDVHFARISSNSWVDYVVVSANGQHASIGIWEGTVVFDKANAFRFADLDGDGRDDFIIVNAHGGIDAWLNRGMEDLVPLANISPSRANVTVDKVQFADVDGDGKADLLIVWEFGAVDAYINTGNLIPSDDGSTNWVDKWRIIPGIDGVTGDKIRFADIDGDGRADLCVVWSGGSIDAYKNTGVLNHDTTKRSWQPLSTPWANKTASPVEPRKIHLADIDGDGQADYLIVFDGSGVEAARNTGNNGDDPKSANFEDWGNIGSKVSGVEGSQVYFADWNGDQKADYIIVNDDFSVSVLVNKVQGPTCPA
ncbi:hypothetical protein F5884DRAFT_860774 [Xylogone sp. PMI_703]|nr:hypothetical protein F5884DRAFT_860774 [Xylogone sp. PMI_703]